MRMATGLSWSVERVGQPGDGGLAGPVGRAGRLGAAIPAGNVDALVHDQRAARRKRDSMHHPLRERNLDSQGVEPLLYPLLELAGHRPLLAWERLEEEAE